MRLCVFMMMQAGQPENWRPEERFMSLKNQTQKRTPPECAALIACLSSPEAARRDPSDILILPQTDKHLGASRPWQALLWDISEVCGKAVISNRFQMPARRPELNSHFLTPAVSTTTTTTTAAEVRHAAKPLRDISSTLSLQLASSLSLLLLLLLLLRLNWWNMVPAHRGRGRLLVWNPQSSNANA